MKHICALAFLTAFISLSPAFAAGNDPFKVHPAGFGPEIRGLQLGKPMTYPEMINEQREMNLLGFNMVIADNYKAVDQQNRSSDKPGKWILVTFSTGNLMSGAINISIVNGSRDVLSNLTENGTLNDLFEYLRKSGLNYASTENITLCNDRVIQYSVDKSTLVKETSTTGDFAQRLSKTYSLGVMEKKGHNYEVNSPSEGWRVVVTDDRVTIFSLPVPGNSQK